MSDFQIIVRGPKGPVCDELTTRISNLVAKMQGSNKLGWGTETSPSFTLSLTHPVDKEALKKAQEYQSITDKLNEIAESTDPERVRVLTEEILAMEKVLSEGHSEQYTCSQETIAGRDVTFAVNPKDPDPATTTAMMREEVESHLTKDPDPLGTAALVKAVIDTSAAMRAAIDITLANSDEKTLEDVVPAKLQGLINRLHESNKASDAQDGENREVIQGTVGQEFGATHPESAGPKESTDLGGPLPGTTFEELTGSGVKTIEAPEEMPPLVSGLKTHLSLYQPGSLSGSDYAELLRSLLDFDLIDVVARPAQPPEFIVRLRSSNQHHSAALVEIFSAPELALVNYTTRDDVVQSAQHLTDIVLGDIEHVGDVIKVVFFATARREENSLEFAKSTYSARKEGTQVGQ